MALPDTASLLAVLVLLFHTWGAWAALEVNMEDKVEVFKGETAQITCTFTSEEGMGATTIEWSYVKNVPEEQRIYIKEPDHELVEPGTQFRGRINVNVTLGTVVLTISDVELADELEFICCVKTFTESTKKGRTMLKVFVAPSFPTIEGMQTGISANQSLKSKIGSCEVKNGYPKPNVTWYKNNTPLRNGPEVLVSSSTTSESSGLYSVQSELSLKVQKEDKDATFYCEVTFFVPGATKMTETSRINVTVYYPPTEVNIWVESPKGKIKEGDMIKLHCKHNGNNPSTIVSIKHLKSGNEVDDHIMVVGNATRLNSGDYECTSMDIDTFKPISGKTTVLVNYLDPAVMTPDRIVVVEGENLEASCNALSSLHTDTTWFKDEKVVSKGNRLLVKNATSDMAGTYECVVTVPEIEEMKTKGTVRFSVKGPPKIIEGDQHLETYEMTVNLTCNARGFPAPTIIWKTSEGKFLNSSETKTEESSQSVVTVEVTSNISVQCSAINDFGTNVVTFNIIPITHTTSVITTTTSTTSTITSTTSNTTSTTSTTTLATNTTITATNTTTPASMSSTTVKTPKDPSFRKGGNGFVIAVIIICILLLAVLGSVLYFLYKKGKLCGRSGKQDLTKEKSSKDNFVVEMKSDNTEEQILLGVNGEKQTPSDQ